MFTKAYWLIEGRVLVTVYEGKVTRHDLERAMVIVYQMISKEGSPKGVHVISDGRKKTAIANTLKHPPTVRDITRKVHRHPRLRWSIIVDPDVDIVLAFILTSIAEAGNEKQRFVATMENAIEFLESIDPTLQFDVDDETDDNEDDENL